MIQHLAEKIAQINFQNNCEPKPLSEDARILLKLAEYLDVSLCDQKTGQVRDTIDIFLDLVRNKKSDIANNE